MESDWALRASAGHVPTSHQLRAAARASQVLPAEGASRDLVSGSYGALPTGGIYSRNDLSAGEDILAAAGLVAYENDSVCPHADLVVLRTLPEPELCAGILFKLLAATRPLWVVGATSGNVLSPELVPDGVLGAIDAFLDPLERERRLLELGRRFTDEERRHTGELAERHLVEALRSQLHSAGRADLSARVRRVSLDSDELGYDITAPTRSGDVRRIEAKGTRASGPAYPVYISRNEADVGLSDGAWSLVVCSVASDDSVEVVGWARAHDLAHLLPTDTDPAGHWASTHLTIDVALLCEGLPDA